MRNVMKYLGIVSVSLACAGPLFAMGVQPFAGVSVVQQNVVTVKGQVVDEKGEPVIGANVIVEGTTNGMITDLDGNFSLQCPVGSTLKASYIGYLTRTVKVSGDDECIEDCFKRRCRNIGRSCGGRIRYDEEIRPDRFHYFCKCRGDDET